MPTNDLMQEIERGALRLGVEAAAVAAVAHVESGLRTHTMINGRPEPLIRFEGHYFDRRLSGEKRARARRLGLASPVAGAIINPAAQVVRWALLARAEAIDRRAAHESVSWGIGQVMGAHWQWLGYANVDALVAEARSGVAGQIRLMTLYIDKAGLSAPLRAHDWQAFSRVYNGPAFRRNSYDIQLARAYRRYAASATGTLRRGDSGDAVRMLQAALARHGYTLQQDGTFGSQTAHAVRQFQAANQLVIDGIAGPATMAALRADDRGGGVFHWLTGLLARLRKGKADGHGFGALLKR